MRRIVQAIRAIGKCSCRCDQCSAPVGQIEHCGNESSGCYM